MSDDLSLAFTRLSYPSRTLQSLGRIAMKVDALVSVVDREVAKAPPTFTAEDAFYLAEGLASRGTEGLPHGSHVETQTVDTTTPLQRPYGRTYTTICTTVTIFVARQSGWEGSDNQDGHFGGRGDVIIVAAQR
jgi:hypothetical protein